MKKSIFILFSKMGFVGYVLIIGSLNFLVQEPGLRTGLQLLGCLGWRYLITFVSGFVLSGGFGR